MQQSRSFQSTNAMSTNLELIDSLSPPAPDAGLDLSPWRRAISRLDPVRQNGRVAQVVGLVVESTGPAARVGDLCEIHSDRARPPIPAEVVGFRNGRTLLMPLGRLDGVRAGSEVISRRRAQHLRVGRGLLGRVLNGLGQPMDGGPRLDLPDLAPINADPPDAITRPRIREPISVGVRSVDGVLTLGRGQRAGIFAGSGVGKSTLLGMMARYTSAGVNVIALVGERGREVRDFLEDSLGEEGRKRSVVVVSTSDQPALLRIKAALVATTIAEYFRDQGEHVLLLMDSVTRLAIAQREVGLAIGEPPTTRGYTPSVFALLPRVLERAGSSSRSEGTITGLYTVLVEGDDMNEPVADSVRGTLDGHIVLSRELAHRTHYPAIDVLQSVSRLMPQLVDKPHAAAAARLRETLATYAEAEDLINIGAYAAGSSARIDDARSRIERVRTYLRQAPDEPSSAEQARHELIAMFQDEEA